MVKQDRKQRQRTAACSLRLADMGSMGNPWDIQTPKFAVLDKNFINELPESPTTSEASFASTIRSFDHGFEGCWNDYPNFNLNR